jgi:catechol 2,3-dioxygenase-like lactoylglutathione lyase family enzyme
MKKSRRKFIGAAGGAALAAQTVSAQTFGVKRFDHVALPMQNTAAMVAFYRAMGFTVDERETACIVHFGDNMINFHRPERWPDPKFTLRAPAAKPPCGDLCFVWDGTAEALSAMLSRANAKIIEGPGKRQGGREGGKYQGTSVYVRDPDGNLLEFMIYG